MKKIARLLTVLAGVALACNVAYADDINIVYEELPQKAKTFITKHFGTNPKIQEVEQDQMTGVYTVELRSGYDIKFDKKGAVVEIDSPDLKDMDTAIVKELLPAKAVSYLIKKKYLSDVDEIKLLRNGDFIVEIDKAMKDRVYRFDKSGNLK